jgi:hypothetical protein
MYGNPQGPGGQYGQQQPRFDLPQQQQLGAPMQSAFYGGQQQQGAPFMQGGIQPGGFQSGPQLHGPPAFQAQGQLLGGIPQLQMQPQMLQPMQQPQQMYGGGGMPMGMGGPQMQMAQQQFPPQQQMQGPGIMGGGGGPPMLQGGYRAPPMQQQYGAPPMQQQPPPYQEQRPAPYGGAVAAAAPSGPRAPLALPPPGTPLFGSRLFVANVMNAPVEEIARWFSLYGPLAAPPEKYSTFAFVEFAEPGQAIAAMYGENGRPFAGRRLEVKPALTRDQAAMLGRGKAGGPPPPVYGAPAPRPEEGYPPSSSSGGYVQPVYGAGAPAAGYVAPATSSGGLPKKLPGGYPPIPAVGVVAAAAGMKRGREEERLPPNSFAARKRLEDAALAIATAPAPGVREAGGRVFFSEFPARAHADKLLAALKAVSDGEVGVRADLAFLPLPRGAAPPPQGTVPMSLADLTSSSFAFAAAVSAKDAKEGCVSLTLSDDVAAAAISAGISAPQRHVLPPSPTPEGEGAGAAPEAVTPAIEYGVGEVLLPIPCVNLSLPSIEAAAELLKAALGAWNAALRASAEAASAAAEAEYEAMSRAGGEEESGPAQDPRDPRRESEDPRMAAPPPPAAAAPSAASNLLSRVLSKLSGLAPPPAAVAAPPVEAASVPASAEEAPGS